MRTWPKNPLQLLLLQAQLGAIGKFPYWPFKGRQKFPREFHAAVLTKMLLNPIGVRAYNHPFELRMKAFLLTFQGTSI